MNILYITLILVNLLTTVGIKEPAQTGNQYKTQLNSAKGIVTVPFSYNPPLNNHLIINVSINNSQPLPFMFDTNCIASVVVTREVARKLKLKIDDNAGFLYARTKKGVRTGLSKCDSLIIAGRGEEADLELGPETVWVVDDNEADLLQKTGVVGTIGFGAMTNFILQIDYVRKELHVTQDPDYVWPAGPDIMICDLVRRDEKTGLAPRIRARTEQGQELLFSIDTGSDKTVITKSIKDMFFGEACHSWFIDGKADGYTCRINRLTIGNMSLSPFYGEFIPNVDIGNLLGNDFLSQFLVSIDFHHGKLVLERPPNSTWQPRAPGATTCRIERRSDGNVYIGGVLPPVRAMDESKTNQPELKVNDRLLAIDGISVGGMALFQIQSLLDGFAGQMAKVDVIRSNQPKTANFERPAPVFSDRIPKQQKKQKELQFSYKKDAVTNRFLLTRFDVPGNGKSSNLSIRPGDEVLFLNDIAIKDFDSATAQRLSEGDVIVLTIRSQKDGHIKQIRIIDGHYEIIDDGNDQ